MTRENRKQFGWSHAAFLRNPWYGTAYAPSNHVISCRISSTADTPDRRADLLADQARALAPRTRIGLDTNEGVNAAQWAHARDCGAFEIIDHHADENHEKSYDVDDVPF